MGDTGRHMNGSRYGGRSNDYGYKMPIRKSAEAMRRNRKGKTMR
jgi:hypothetical protein